MKAQAVLPVEQALVPFYEGQILSALLPDDLIAASVNSLCDLLKILKRGQIRRILRDPVLAKHLLRVIIETPGGPQATEMLAAKAIPLWLTGLQPNMVAPEKRPLILALKEEAMDVLYRHFFKVHAEPSPPPKGHAAPPRSSRQLFYEAIDALYQEQDERFAAVGSRQDTVEEAQAALGERQTTLEERQAVVEEVQEALGEHLVETQARVTRLERDAPFTPVQRGWQTPASPAMPSGPLLSKDHLYELYALARDERRRSGQRVDALLGELAEAFGVADLSDLPDAAWNQARAWFWQRGQRG